MKLPIKPAVRFVVCFVCWYVALLFLWPIAGQAYCAAFRAVGTLLHGSNDQRKEISFEPLLSGYRDDYTRVVIVNPAMMKADGSGPVRHLDLDTRAFGWKPLVLLFALVLATPLPLGRRMRALLWGSLCQQGFVMLALGFCIWQESREIGLVSLSAAAKEAAMGVRSLLTGQLAVAVPVLIWLLVTFRRGDFEKMTQQTGLTESPQSRQNAP